MSLEGIEGGGNATLSKDILDAGDQDFIRLLVLFHPTRISYASLVQQHYAWVDYWKS
jgi:hypothetical protein